MSEQGIFLVAALCAPAKLNKKGTYANAYVLVGGSTTPLRINGKADAMAPILGCPVGSEVQVELWTPRVDKFDPERVEFGVREVIDIKAPATV